MTRRTGRNHTRKIIEPNLWGKIIIFLFQSELDDFVVVKVKGFGIFLVDRIRGGQRMTIHIPWYRAFW